MQEDNNTNKIKIQGVKPKKIEKEKNVKMTIQGNNYVDVLDMERPAKATIKKLDKKHYCVLRTGEIKEYKKEETTEKDKDNLKKTFARLRQLIRTNFTKDGHNQLFITLTYAENMTDEKRLYNDFKAFFKRLQYRLKGHKLDYIAVMEPQGRGAWHVHLMLKSDKPILFLDNVELEKIWGLGYTETQRLKSDDVGSYYVAYFTDILQEGKDGSKKHKKGSRLHLYPKGFKFYRTSRGIRKPDEIMAEYGGLEFYDNEKAKELKTIHREPCTKLISFWEPRGGFGGGTPAKVYIYPCQKDSNGGTGV